MEEGAYTDRSREVNFQPVGVLSISFVRERLAPTVGPREIREEKSEPDAIYHMENKKMSEAEKMALLMSLSKEDGVNETQE